MTTKYTPGPWKASETLSNGFEIYGTTKNDLDTVAKTYDSSVEGREAANAQLIAAAPELFKAVNMALNLITNGHHENSTSTVNYAEAMHVFSYLKYVYHKANGTLEEMQRKGEL